MRMFFVLVFLLMSCSGVFGQEVANKDVVSTSVEVSAKEQENSKMEMVKWFMGSGQTTSGVRMKEATKATSKKDMINAGITPNRILSRTILKKAMTFDQAVA